MLDLTRIRVWLPRRGLALRHDALTVTPGIVTALVGPAGTGTSTLLRLINRSLPAGARTEGTVRLDGRDLLTAEVGQVLRRQLFLAHGPEDPRTVRSLLAGVGAEAEGHGLAGHLDWPVSSLPPDLAAQVQVALLEHTSGRRVVLVDQLASALSPQWRRRLGAALRDHASQGAHVLWAEHQLDTVWEFADAVVEPGGVAVSASTWRPDSVREPTLRSLSRLAGLSPEAPRAPEDLVDALPRAEVVGGGSRARFNGQGHSVALETLGISSDRSLDIRPGECIAVVDVGGRAEPVARRLIHALRGTRIPSRLPSELTPDTICRQWDLRHSTLTRTGLADLPGIRPGSPLATHSDGEIAALRIHLARDLTAPLWFPHPQLGLDQARQIGLQTDLAHGSAGVRVVTSRDLEFLIRACHRLLVLDGTRLVGSGSPRAVLQLLPERPLVARAFPDTGAVRLGDLIESLAVAR